MASSFPRKRRKWERKGETKRPGLQVLEVTERQSTAPPWLNPGSPGPLFLSVHLVNVWFPWGQFCPAAFWKQVACRDVIRVSQSDICSPHNAPLPSFQLGPHHTFPGTPTLSSAHTGCGAHGLRQSEREGDHFLRGSLGGPWGWGSGQRRDGLTQLLQAMQVSKENTAGERERERGAGLSEC